MRQTKNLVPGSEVPEPHTPIFAGGRQSEAVGTKRDAAHTSPVGKIASFRPVFDVPKPDRSIISADCQGSAVWTDGQTREMPAQASRRAGAEPEPLQIVPFPATQRS